MILKPHENDEDFNDGFIGADGMGIAFGRCRSEIVRACTCCCVWMRQAVVIFKVLFFCQQTPMSPGVIVECHIDISTLGFIEMSTEFGMNILGCVVKGLS